MISDDYPPFCSHDAEISMTSLQWRHNERDGVSNHQPHDYLLNRLFRRRSKKISKFCVSALCMGNSPVNSPQKGPVTRKCFHLMTSSLYKTRDRTTTDKHVHQKKYMKHISTSIYVTQVRRLNLFQSKYVRAYTYRLFSSFHLFYIFTGCTFVPLCIIVIYEQ